ncbi:hypothetical protein A2U01_0043646, partial [Trifolium medium]|nr:hypothetical protein [Trifolium medium]
MDGSNGVFHDMSFTFSPVILLLVTFMFGNIIFEGCWKLSHIVLPVVSARSTRFPVSRCLEVELVAIFDTFDVQISSFFPFSTTRLPSLDILTTPEESLRGCSLLSTNTT